MAASRVSELYRRAFVTGASTGLGRAFTQMLLDEGVEVWGTSRDITRLRELAATPRGRFHPVALDLKDAAQVETVFRAAERAAMDPDRERSGMGRNDDERGREFGGAGRENRRGGGASRESVGGVGEDGGFDLVINNAGFGVFGEFTEVDFGTWQQQLEVMLVAPARLSHLALGSMLARNRGALVNISSLAAEFPLPFQSAYNMTKAGLSALNESLMIETAGTNVVILDVRPGDYRTDFDGAVLRPQRAPGPRVTRAWAAFEKMMRSGPPPAHAAAALRRALLRQRSTTLRTGRVFQAVIAPFISRFGSLALRRRIQASYFDVS